MPCVHMGIRFPTQLATLSLQHIQTAVTQLRLVVERHHRVCSRDDPDISLSNRHIIVVVGRFFAATLVHIVAGEYARLTEHDRLAARFGRERGRPQRRPRRVLL